MSLLQNSNAISAGGYDINNSLRFRQSASAFLSRTPASASNRQTWTWSGWVKRGRLDIDNHTLFTGRTSAAATYTIFLFNPTNNLWLIDNGGTSLVSTAVYRDPSAWYHVVLAVDTTQATAANRVKMYVNGAQITSFSTATYPTLNANLNVNSTATQVIGDNTGAAQYFDGQMAEINFVDGQALTPSSFGETDAVTGSWVAKKYTGTYGTNGFYLPFKLNNTSSFQATFSTSSTYLSVANNTALQFGTGDYTVEFWINQSSLSTFQSAYAKGYVAAGDFVIQSNSTTGYMVVYHSGTAVASETAGTINTNQWYHIAAVRSGTTVTLYRNGIPVATGTSSTNLNSTLTTTIGNASVYPVIGAMSNVRVVKGTAVYTAKFTPPSTALTAISGTSLLTIQNSSAIDNSTNAFTVTNNGSVPFASATPFVANITADNSGNANNWTPNNINYSTSGVTYDAMTDVPTNTSATVANYATLNPIVYNTGLTTYSNANLSASLGNASNWRSVLSTIYARSGLLYAEMTVSSNANNFFGVALASSTFWNAGGVSIVGWTSDSWSWNAGSKYNNATGVSYGPGVSAAGDIVGIALDLDNGAIYFSLNGTWQGSGVPTSGASKTNAAYSLTTGLDYVFAMSGVGGTTASINFGQRPFAYTPPTGYKALNTYNLPDSTIKKGNTVMDATLYTGNGSTQTITNAAGFKPDLVWTKARSIAYSNILYDSVRGTGNTKNLSSDTTNAEPAFSTNANLTSFDSNGWSIGSTSSTNIINASGQTFVGWQWQAGQGSTSSNTSGSVTSTVSVNATAGLSVLTATCPASGVYTVGHGLGVAPSMVIFKDRNSGAAAWGVYHKSVCTTTSLYLTLNSTAALASAAGIWGSTLPTSTVVSSTAGIGIIAGNPFVMYCWAEIAGFSKFGSYTGNGSADGPFVYLGFRPKFLMIKSSSAAGVWEMIDTSRDPINVTGLLLRANSSGAEINGTPINDILSNGFKPRSTNGNQNDSGVTYIYMAFAENPFKNANAR